MESGASTLLVENYNFEFMYLYKLTYSKKIIYLEN
jgi:hypothetical protein